MYGPYWKIYSTQYKVLDFNQRPIEQQDLQSTYWHFLFFLNPDTIDMQDREGAWATETAAIHFNDPNISVLRKPDKISSNHFIIIL